MRDINLDTTVTRNTFMLYGALGSGKTRYAATFERPLFLSEGVEGGWTTIKYMADDEFYEHGRKPKIWAIEQMSDMAEAMVKVAPLVASGEVKTIVVDSLTFYADMYLAGLVRANSNDMRAVYGSLGMHLRDLRVQWHTRYPNVTMVWLALAKEPEEDLPGCPLVPGKEGLKFAAGCDFVFYLRSWGDKLGSHFAIHTRPYNKYSARVRDGAKLQMPSILPDSNYRTLKSILDGTYVLPVVEDAIQTTDEGVAHAPPPRANGARRAPILRR